MPVKMKKQKIKITQKPEDDTEISRAGLTRISKASPSNAGTSRDPPAGVDLGSTPVEDLSEALINQYGLTSKRPIVVGSFDFYPLFNSRVEPTPESEMFDMQLAASDLAFISTRGMLRKVGFKSESMKMLDLRYQQKVAESADIANTLDNIHGLIRLITDDMDIKRNTRSIRLKTSVRITRGANHTAQQRGGDDWNTQYSPSKTSSPSSFSLKNFFTSMYVNEIVWQRQCNTATLTQLIYELHMLMKYGPPSWYGIGALDRSLGTTEKFDHLMPPFPRLHELDGLEIVPWGDTSDRKAFRYIDNALQSPFNAQIFDPIMWAAGANRVRERLEAFGQYIKGDARILESTAYIGTILGIIAKDIRATTALKSGDMDEYIKEFGLESIVGLQGIKILSSMDARTYESMLSKFTGIQKTKAEHGDAMAVLMGQKKNIKSLISSLYVSKNNPGGIPGIEDFGLPFEKDQISDNYENNTVKTLFVNQPFTEGTFGDFSNFNRFVSFYRERTDTALSALATLDGWHTDSVSISHGSKGGRADGQRLSRLIANEIASYTNDIGFHYKDPGINTGDYSDAQKVDGIRLGIIKAASKDSSVKTELLKHLLYYQRLKIIHGDFSEDLIRSAEDPNTKSGSKYGTRTTLDPDSHIAGSMFLDSEAWGSAIAELKKTDQRYYDSIFSLGQSALGFFSSQTAGTKNALVEPVPMDGVKIGAINLRYRRFTFGIVNAAGKYTNTGTAGYQSMMGREGASAGNPIFVGLMPSNESMNTIFKLPGKITDMIVKNINAQGTVIEKPSKSDFFKKSQTTAILSLGYWNIYAIACEIVIEMISENFNFNVAYDPSHVEDSALFKHQKRGNKQKDIDKVNRWAASDRYTYSGKIADIHNVDLYRQVQSVFAFQWAPAQWQGLHNAWSHTSISHQEYRKIVKSTDLTPGGKKIAKYYHKKLGSIIQQADHGDEQTQGAIEFLAGVGNHMGKIKRDIGKVLGSAASVGGMRKFFKDLNTNPQYKLYMQSISEMQTHNRRNALVRLGTPSTKYGFMPSSEVVSSRKIKQILAMMTDPKYSRKGRDSGVDNDRILAIGIPAGMLDQLREIGFKESADNGEEYARSTFVKIDIYKRDLRDDTRTFLPVTKIFDMSLFGTDDNANFDFDLSNLSVTDKTAGNNATVFRSNQLKTTEPEDVIPLWDEVWNSGMKYARYYTNYDSKKSRIVRPGSQWVYFYKKGDVSGKIAKDIVENHAVNDLLKSYLKSISGIDLYEDSFILGGTAEDYAGRDDPVSTSPVKKKGVSSADVMVERMFNKFIDRNNVIKAVARLATSKMSEKRKTNKMEILQRNVSTAERSKYFQAEKIKNRISQPKIFDRIFCLVVDPITGFREIPPDIEDESSAKYIGSEDKDKFIKDALYSVVPSRHQAERIGSHIDTEGNDRQNSRHPFKSIEKFSANCFDFYVTVSILPDLR